MLGYFGLIPQSESRGPYRFTDYQSCSAQVSTTTPAPVTVGICGYASFPACASGNKCHYLCGQGACDSLTIYAGT